VAEGNKQYFLHACQLERGKLAYISGKHMTLAQEMRRKAHKPDRFGSLLVSLHDNLLGYMKARNDSNAINGLIDAVIAVLDVPLQPNERILVSEILISLVNQVDRNMRESLSFKLALRDDVPETLLHYLIYDDIDMAGAILQYSRQLSEQDLSYIIHSRGKDHWNAIATRDDLTDRLVEQLASKQDADAMAILFENGSIRIAENVSAPALADA